MFESGDETAKGGALLSSVLAMVSMLFDVALDGFRFESVLNICASSGAREGVFGVSCVSPYRSVEDSVACLVVGTDV